MRPGDTVTLRVAGARGRTEVVGVLLAADAGELAVRRRDGSVVRVAVADVEAARVVPPGPAQRVPVADLERVAAAGWRPAETEALGAWVLRAAGGLSGRANSALALGDPGMPAAKALSAAAGWYAGRGLVPRLHTVDAPGGTPADVLARLSADGWGASAPVHVMVAEAAHVLRAAGEPDRRVAVSGVPGAAWIAAWVAAHRRNAPGRVGGALPPDALAVLTRHDRVAFAELTVDAADDGHSGGMVDPVRPATAIARVAVDGRWAGLYAVEVAPHARRRGLATAVVAGALRWAVGAGARRVYLQVQSTNAPAVALWGRLGFAVHHDYVTWSAPGS